MHICHSDDGNGRWLASGGCEVCRKFAAVHVSIHNYFNQKRHLTSRNNFKLHRAAALAEWRQLLAA
jgi:hypothetical protein